MSRKQWANFFAKLTFWLMAEVVLTCLGLDDWSDYSEFLLAKPMIDFSPPIVIIL